MENNRRKIGNIVFYCIGQKVSQAQIYESVHSV